MEFGGHHFAIIILVKVFVILLVIIIVGAGLFFVFKGKTGIQNNSSSTSFVNWNFDYNTKTWQASGNPPACPDPLVISSPVDVGLASGILYPGQLRGNDYKPHGGFRFDTRDTNDVELRAIMDGYIIKASKYLESGEPQVAIFYINDCGLMVMHDHLLTLSPKLEKAFENIPLGAEGDSRTTFLEPRVFIEKGEVLATEIGHKNFEGRKNIFVDFGLYDLRKTNGVNYDAAFRANNPNIGEYGVHALCWFDYLNELDESFARVLPAGGNEGKISDYCN